LNFCSYGGLPKIDCSVLSNTKNRGGGQKAAIDVFAVTRLGERDGGGKRLSP
jgi:hypothetical protein